VVAAAVVVVAPSEPVAAASSAFGVPVSHFSGYGSGDSPP